MCFIPCPLLPLFMGKTEYVVVIVLDPPTAALPNFIGSDGVVEGVGLV